MDKTQFNEALTSLMEFASTNQNRITKSDIELYFKNIIDDASMYNAIYSYLKENKIKIEDIDDNDILDLPTYAEEEAESKAATISSIPTESEEELAFLDMYRTDVENVTPLTTEEKSKLISDIKSGDSTASNRLAEVYLTMVQEIAENYKGQGLTLGDLIQEGNIGLIIALSEFEGNESDIDTYLNQSITKAIESAIADQVSSQRIGSHLADRMNSLDSVSKDLTEKLGHAPSVEELSKEMNISEDEVETIIRTSLNVLSVEPSEE